MIGAKPKQNQAKPCKTKTKNIAKTMVWDKFWVNFDMFGIKKYVLKLENWMVTLNKLFETNQNQTRQNQNQTYSQNHGLGQILEQ